MEIRAIHIIPLVLVAIILAGGIYYWQKNTRLDNNIATINSISKPNSEGLVLGDSNDDKTSSINDGQVYLSKISEIRKPINDNFSDLTDKMKYPNLFPKEEVLKIINEIEQKINEGINVLNKLSVADKYQDVNKKEIESLNLLKESLDYLRKSYDAGNKNAQADREAFAYKIDQSNNILKNIQIPN